MVHELCCELGFYTAVMWWYCGYVIGPIEVCSQVQQSLNFLLATVVDILTITESRNQDCSSHHLVLAVDVGSCLQQSLNCLSMSFLGSYPQRNTAWSLEREDRN